jgi:hypothetical protein
MPLTAILNTTEAVLTLRLGGGSVIQSGPLAITLAYYLENQHA